MFSCGCLPMAGQHKPCIFCTIRASLETRIVAETEDLLAFTDRSPSANVHILVIPKKHIGTVKDLTNGDIPLLEKMTALGQQLLSEQGYNVKDTSQIRLGFHVPPFNSVDHLHLHVIGLPFKNVFRKYKYQPRTIWYADAQIVLEKLLEIGEMR